MPSKADDDLMGDELNREALARALGRIEGELASLGEDMRELKSGVVAVEKRLGPLEISQTSIATDVATMKPAVDEWASLSSRTKGIRKAVIWVAGPAIALGFWQALDVIDRGIDMLRGMGK